MTSTSSNTLGHNYSHGKKLRTPVYIKINQLQPGTRGHNIKAKVDQIKNVLERPRRDGSTLTIAEVLIGDETGCVLFTARNEQIEMIKDAKEIILRNCKVEMFKGFMRLAVDMWGLIEKTSGNISKIDLTNNLSDTEYELVTVEFFVP